VTDVIVEVVPLGLAVAASPFGIIPAILLLFTPRAKAASLGFLTGWLLGVIAVTTVFVLLATVIEARDEPAPWASWTKLVLGAALVVLGARQWLGRHAKDDPPAWMASIDALAPSGALRLGFLLSAVNPKIVMLTAAAGLVVGAAALGAAGAAVATAVFALLAASTVALPVTLYAVAGERVLGPLARARTWLQENNAAVMAVVITAIGVVLVVEGFQGL